MKYIYLINKQNTNIYKIGITKNIPAARVKQLQTGCDFKLTLQDSYCSNYFHEIEKALHKLFSHKKYIEEDFKKVEGEWFLLETKDVIGFKESCKKIEESLEFLNKNSTLYNFPDIYKEKSFENYKGYR